MWKTFFELNVTDPIFFYQAVVELATARRHRGFHTLRHRGTEKI